MFIHANWRQQNAFAACLVAVVLCVACGRPGSPYANEPALDAPRMEVLKALLQGDRGVMTVAHRACWRSAPENSTKSIEECIRIGVEMVEIDVRRTKDGHLVVIHDDSVDRTTSGRGLVADLTLSEIRALRLRTGAGGEDASLTDFQVPMLGEALEAAKGRILVNLDAKADVRDDAFQLASELGVTDQILIKVPMSAPADFDLEQTTFFGNTFFMPIVRESRGPLGAQVGSLESTAAVAYEVIYESEAQLADACREAEQQGSRCWVNTMWESLSPGHSDDVSVIDPDKHWGYLVGLGVNVFQTDRPAELIKYLDSKGLR